MTILSGHNHGNKDWKRILLILFLVSMWVATIVQCATGSDVLRWRSFYASHDIAWRAHYQEVFDHGIREVLCCLGRAKYSYVPVLGQSYMKHLIPDNLTEQFWTLIGVCWKMTIYVLWQSYWVTLWLIAHLELAILSLQQVEFLFTLQFQFNHFQCLRICMISLHLIYKSMHH